MYADAHPKLKPRCIYNVLKPALLLQGSEKFMIQKPKPKAGCTPLKDDIYTSRGRKEKKMETTIVYWGIMEKKMETT